MKSLPKVCWIGALRVFVNCFNAWFFLFFFLDEAVKRSRDGEVTQNSTGGDVVVEAPKEADAAAAAQEAPKKKVRTHKKRRIAILYGYCGKGKTRTDMSVCRFIFEERGLFSLFDFVSKIQDIMDRRKVQETIRRLRERWKWRCVMLKRLTRT